MRWLATFALLSCFSAVSSWAAPYSERDSSSSSTGSPQEASGAVSRSPNATWERLDELLNRLESSAEASSVDSQSLAASLEAARSRLTELSTLLSESATQAAGLSSSLERCERSLELSEASLREALAESLRRDAELRLWRWTAGLGAAAGIAGLAWGLAASSR